MGYGLAYMHTVSLFYILMGLLFVPNGMLRGAGDMAAFTFSSMANLFSRVGIAYALVYLHPGWGPTPSGVHPRRLADRRGGLPAPGQEWKVDAQGCGRPLTLAGGLFQESQVLWI